MLGKYLRNRRRKKQLEVSRDKANEWLRQKMYVEEPADDVYDKEILPRLSPVNFAFENKELNKATDPWVSATEKWFSQKNA